MARGTALGSGSVARSSWGKAPSARRRQGSRAGLCGAVAEVTHLYLQGYLPKSTEGAVSNPCQWHADGVGGTGGEGSVQGRKLWWNNEHLSRVRNCWHPMFLPEQQLGSAHQGAEPRVSVGCTEREAALAHSLAAAKGRGRRGSTGQRGGKSLRMTD